MPRTLTEKLIDAHLVEGDAVVGEEIALRIGQTLTQDATGAWPCRELELPESVGQVVVDASSGDESDGAQ